MSRVHLHSDVDFTHCSTPFPAKIASEKHLMKEFDGNVPFHKIIRILSAILILHFANYQGCNRIKPSCLALWRCCLPHRADTSSSTTTIYLSPHENYFWYSANCFCDGSEWVTKLRLLWQSLDSFNYNKYMII